MVAGRQRRWRLDRPLDLARTLWPLRHGAGDPTTRVDGGVFWRTSRTPDGPATMAVRMIGRDEVDVQAWGAGAEWLLETAPDLLGEGDDWTGLELDDVDILRELRRTLPGVRLCCSNRVMESLVPAVLEQRVTGREAWRAWRDLVRTYGEPAPGPAEPRLWLAPHPEALRSVPSWDWHRFGVDLNRHRAIRAAAVVADRLEESSALAAAGDHLAASRRLRLVPGIGEWTAAEVAVRAYGDPDAVSVGDFHVKNRVGWVLAGRVRTDDDTMVELLERWRGHRARVVRLIELSGLAPPKFGPRFSPNDIRAI